MIDNTFAQKVSTELGSSRVLPFSIDSLFNRLGPQNGVPGEDLLESTSALQYPVGLSIVRCRSVRPRTESGAFYDTQKVCRSARSPEYKYYTVVQRRCLSHPPSYSPKFRTRVSSIGRHVSSLLGYIHVRI